MGKELRSDRKKCWVGPSCIDLISTGKFIYTCNLKLYFYRENFFTETFSLVGITPCFQHQFVVISVYHSEVVFRDSCPSHTAPLPPEIFPPSMTWAILCWLKWCRVRTHRGLHCCGHPHCSVNWLQCISCTVTGSNFQTLVLNFQMPVSILRFSNLGMKNFQGKAG